MDSVYGGSLRVCVTQIGDSYYGQAKFSEIGYMRGEISDDSTWTGEYWLAGREGRYGTFTLTVIDIGADKAYTGEFSDSPGIVYSMYGNRSSSDEPEDIDCFKADDDMLESSISFDYTGRWVKPVGKGVRFIYVESGGTSSSYYYSESQYPGFNIGALSTNGQVYASNWYESATAEGLYLFVAKNSTTFYSLWWAFKNVAEFDYSKVSDANYFGQGLNYKDIYTLVTSDDSHMYQCYELSIENDENACVNSVYGENDNNLEDDDDDDGRLRIGISTLVVSCFTLLFVIMSLLYQTFGQPKPPLSSQRNNSNSQL